MQGLWWQATALSVEADLQVLGKRGEMTPGTHHRVILTVGAITSRATFSLLEASDELRWEAATSASTVSV